MPITTLIKNCNINKKIMLQCQNYYNLLVINSVKTLFERKFFKRKKLFLECIEKKILELPMPCYPSLAPKMYIYISQESHRGQF